MQYKENETMDEKAVVKLDADGDVVKCAKDLAAGECGYKAGAKVCGACGAMAVSAKAEDEADPEDEMEESEEEMDEKAEDVMDDESDDEEKAEDDEEDDSEEKVAGAYIRRAVTNGPRRALRKRRRRRKGDGMAYDDGDDMDGEEEEKAADSETSIDEEIAELEKELAALKKERSEMMDGSDEDQDDDDEKMMSMHDMRKRGRARRMKSLEVSTDNSDEEIFSCFFDRKVYGASESVCENCPGGCKSANGGPNMLEIEGIAEDMFSGKVLDSGYGDVIDSFVVDVQRKDGKIVEAFFDGATGECLGWHMLLDDDFSQKSAMDSEQDIIDFDRAADIAIGQIEGKVLAVQPDLFEGMDSYAVEIDGVDGKSYDVYVGLDGEVLGYDEYTAEEAENIEAEAAEIALKRAYSDDDREKMAEDGLALPDGSYPIKDEDDLRNAIQAFGRAKDKDKAKAHIMKRAADLSMEELIPEKWTAKSDEGEEVDEVVESDDAEEAEIALKRAYDEDEREKMAKAGHALPDGSFPIKDEEDLRNAIRAYGRASDKQLAKAHIMKRALDLKLEDLIPENWVPKKVQEEAAEGTKDASDEFLLSLMEFEIINAEQEARSSLSDDI